MVCLLLCVHLSLYLCLDIHICKLTVYLGVSVHPCFGHFKDKLFVFRYGTRSRTSLLPKEWADAQDVSLVVNVASECGFTDQHYRALQQLQRDLGPHHFNVLAFPCNQFGQQEPDTNKEIESFARRTYSVSFPMFSKVAVTGAGAHPAFKYLIPLEPLWACP
ncbi:glutathione peroxidase 7 isoform X3 [Ursus americanus]|uniref:glutathione peroxidase 7 isoform X3 n=1 Tax=Ursus americanus TaxID=9643 RepID=UPI001E67C4F6|nr:glutathione peroxidase 7 isoform X3 [Ursus americanus]XP_057166780.1 glutathione peroxidase 7 isoform X2 [Ursus arctos]